MLFLTIVVLLTSDIPFIDDKDDAMVCLYYSPLLHHSEGHYR